MIPSSHSDAGLWLSFKAGNRNSFKEIYEKFYDSLFEYGFRISNDLQLVEDVIQELFIKIWNNRARLGDVTSVKSYLFVSLRGAIFNKLEKDYRIRTQELNESVFDLVFSVESEFIDKESNEMRANKIKEALNQLTSRQKEFIYLRFYEEVSFEEIAKILNITTKASYKLNARALESLKQLIDFPLLLTVLIFFPFEI